MTLTVEREVLEVARTVNTIFRPASYLTRLAGGRGNPTRFPHGQIVAKEISIAAWPR